MRSTLAILAILLIALLIAGCVPAKKKKPELAPLYVGVVYELITEENQTGLRITKVTPKTPAHEAGILKGDILKQFNGHTLETHEDFVYWMRQATPGEQIILTIDRNGKIIDYTVTPKPRR